MRYYYVDYENVNEDERLENISELKLMDVVHFYYSNENAKRLSMDMHIRISQATAQVEYTEVKDRIKNALDCRIIFDIRDQVKSNPKAEYYIVSGDKDYDDMIAELSAEGVKIKRVAGIGNGGTSATTKKKRTTAQELAALLERNTTKKEKTPAEKKAVEKKAVEKKAVEKKAVEKRAVEKRAVEKKAVGKKTVDKKKATDKKPLMDKKKPVDKSKSKVGKSGEQQIRALFGQYLKKYDADKEDIIRIMVQANSKQQINNDMMQKMKDGAKVKEITKAFMPYMKKLPGEVVEIK